MTDQPGDFAVNPTVFRTALRQEKIAARLALPAAEHHAASARILEHLADLLQPRAPGIIAFCWPIRAEVDCQPLVNQLLSAGWRAAMPVVVTTAAPMQFRAWWPDAPMAADPHGIPVPLTDAMPAPDVLLLPLVAFDAAGYRLGYGGGYFDRTLAACVPRPLTVGVGFELGAVDSIRPAAHDIPLDMIATENGLRLTQTQHKPRIPLDFP
jgi:5,10-methenyltetrahydrofolate synthetase